MTTPYATIAHSRYISFQGPVLQKHADGRITIDAGNRVVTGHAVKHIAVKPAPLRIIRNSDPAYA